MLQRGKKAGGSLCSLAYQLCQVRWAKPTRATLEILLQQDVKGVGDAGNKVRVLKGFARNFLIPQKLAVPVLSDRIRRRNYRLRWKELSLAEAAQHAQQSSEKDATPLDSDATAPESSASARVDDVASADAVVGEQVAPELSPAEVPDQSTAPAASEAPEHVNTAAALEDSAAAEPGSSEAESPDYSQAASAGSGSLEAGIPGFVQTASASNSEAASSSQDAADTTGVSDAGGSSYSEGQTQEYQAPGPSGYYDDGSQQGQYSPVSPGYPQPGYGQAPEYGQAPAAAAEYSQAPGYTPDFSQAPGYTPDYSQSPGYPPNYSQAPGYTPPDYSQAPGYAPGYSQAPGYGFGYGQTPGYAPGYSGGAPVQQSAAAPAPTDKALAEDKELQELLQKIMSQPLVFKRTASDGEALERGLAVADIVEAAERQLKVRLAPGLLLMDDPIAETGDYSVPLRILLPSGERVALTVSIQART